MDSRGACVRRFQFMSGMLRDVVYHSMLFAQRRRLHRAAALALGTSQKSTSLHCVWRCRCAPVVHVPLPCHVRTESINASTLSVESLYLSERERYKHLYRHLALSGQRERAGEVFDTRFGGGGGGRQARMPSVVSVALGTSPSASRKGSVTTLHQFPSPIPSTRTLQGSTSLQVHGRALSSSTASDALASHLAAGANGLPSGLVVNTRSPVMRRRSVGTVVPKPSALSPGAGTGAGNGLPPLPAGTLSG